MSDQNLPQNNLMDKEKTDGIVEVVRMAADKLKQAANDKSGVDGALSGLSAALSGAKEEMGLGSLIELREGNGEGLKGYARNRFRSVVAGALADTVNAGHLDSVLKSKALEHAGDLEIFLEISGGQKDVLNKLKNAYNNTFAGASQTASPEVVHAISAGQGRGQ